MRSLYLEQLHMRLPQLCDQQRGGHVVLARQITYCRVFTNAGLRKRKRDHEPLNASSMQVGMNVQYFHQGIPEVCFIVADGGDTLRAGCRATRIDRSI